MKSLVISALVWFIFVLVIMVVPASTVLADEKAIILCPKNPEVVERLAAREIRRYLYLRTDQYPSIVAFKGKLPQESPLIVIGQKDQSLVKQVIEQYDDLGSTVASLKPQQFLLKTIPETSPPMVLIAGGDGIGTLYGAYRFVEHLGVRFYLHGDTIPDEGIPLKLPFLDEKGAPLFALRGINSWGTHPFGFDLWSEDDYKSIFAQLTKMRMNFLGIHCYPEGLPYAEPTVWLGQKGDFDDEGNVKFSYPSRYYNTSARGNWGPILPKKTSAYSFGGSLLFERDDWGPPVMADFAPEPTAGEESNELFNRTGSQFKGAFTFARLLGVKTCVGTEAPLTIPKLFGERLQQQGKDPNHPETIREIYEGMFERIMRTHPLDYYWIWTSENWTWGDNTQNQSKSVTSDMEIAFEALTNVKAPFRLATAGWVLGPREDRAAFGRMLPKEIAVSAISRQLGHEPVDSAFGEITGRESWAIPWLEDDMALGSPQLWVGRTRKDAADALAYGCTGLMGLHWRTRIMGPNVSALAQAGWDQSGWNPQPGKIPSADLLRMPTSLASDDTTREGPIGGSGANYQGQEIANTKDDPLYQSCLYNLKGYNIKVPKGKYCVTLKFCEPHFNAVGKRVWEVQLQGKTVIEKLDIFAQVGQFAALDQVFEEVSVSDGWLKIEFVPHVSLPCISGVLVEGADFSRKINCGGPAYKDFIKDYAGTTIFSFGPPRGGLASEDFYADWALAAFGSQVAQEAAGIFEKIDGRLPRAGGYACPCGLSADNRSWATVAEEYKFVDELAAIRPRVKGAGNLERFDYWLNSFGHLRSLARVQCDLGSFNQAIAKVKEQKDPAVRKSQASRVVLPLYKNLLASYGQAYRDLLASVNTNGALACVINLEQSNTFWHRAITASTEQLSGVLDEPLPVDATPDQSYSGPGRIIVPTVRTSLIAGEDLILKVIILDEHRPKQAAFYWRPLGSKAAFSKIDLQHQARAVHTVSLKTPPDDFEYYIKAVTDNDQKLYFPAAAPTMNQTVVIIDNI